MKTGEHTQPRTRVGIATDEPISGRGLLSVVQEDAQYRVLWLPASTERLLQSVGVLAVDILIVDMACEFQPDIAVRLRSVGVRCPIILWARDCGHAHTANGAIRGTTLVLDKRLGPDVVLSCLDTVREGRDWVGMDAEVLQIPTAPIAPVTRLTKREEDLMKLVSLGRNNRQIAENLGLSEGSVKVYFSRLFRKLGVRDRLGLAVLAMQQMPHLADPRRQAVGGVRERH